VNSGCTTCPLLAEKPCDVDFFELEVEFESRPEKGEKEGKSITRKLPTQVVKRRQIQRSTVQSGRTRRTRTVLPYPTLSYHVNDLLTKWDFVIEALADYPVAKSAADLKALVSGGGEKTAKKKAKISAKAKFTGLKCERHEHGLLHIKQLSGGGNFDKTSLKVDVADNSLGPFEFAAIPFPVLDGPYADTDTDGEVQGGASASVTFIFEFFKSLFNSMTPKEVGIVAQACGKRAKGDAKVPNHDLRGLVRIFRKDVWTIGLKIPALGEMKAESSAHRELLTGAKEGKFSSEGRLGGSSSGVTGTTTRNANGVTSTELEREQRSGGQSSSFKQTRTNYGGAITRIGSESKYSDRDGSEMHGYTKGGAIYGRPTRELVEERLKHTTGFDLTIARNGQEVSLGGAFKKIKKAVEMFAKTLAEIQDLFKKAPQVGWKITFEISAFEGTIIAEIGPKPEAPIADGRYYPVNYVTEFKIDLEIIKASFSVSFGLEAMALDTGLVLKVQGTVSISVKVAVNVTLDLITKPEKELEVEGKYTGELKVVGYVSLVGKTVAGGELSISAGFEFADGKLIIDVVKPSFDLKGKLRTQPVKVSGWIKVPWWWDKKIDPPIELLAGHDIYTFK